MNSTRLFSRFYRFFVQLFNFRVHKRSFSMLPRYDVVMVGTYEDMLEPDMIPVRYGNPTSGSLPGPDFTFNHLVGNIRLLQVTAPDLLTLQGREHAREKFYRTVEWAVRNGTRVILLTEGIKHLFGEYGYELKSRFPGIVFTTGESSLTWALAQEVFNSLQYYALRPQSSRIAVIGATGIPGEAVVRTLVREGYFRTVGVGRRGSRLSHLAHEYGIEIRGGLDELSGIDALVLCRPHPEWRLTGALVSRLRRPDRRLLVLDAAEPPGFPREEYQTSRNVVVRQDAGRLFSPNMRFVLNFITTRMMGLHSGVVSARLAEAIALAHYFDKNIQVHQYDWFQVTEQQHQFVGALLQSLGFFVPAPLCFGKPVQIPSLFLEQTSYPAHGHLESSPASS